MFGLLVFENLEFSIPGLKTISIPRQVSPVYVRSWFGKIQVIFMAMSGQVIFLITFKSMFGYFMSISKYFCKF